MPDLMVQLDGQSVPLKQCRWVLFDSKGCAVGSLHGDRAVDGEVAWSHFTPRARERGRQETKGYTVDLLTREQWKRQAEDCFMGRCQHRQEAAA